MLPPFETHDLYILLFEVGVMAPDYSVIIPFFNEERNVERVAMSIYGELVDKKIDFEIILVNNGSLDSTLKLCEDLSSRFEEIKTIHVEKNVGYGKGVLSGLASAQGKYVCYTDGDGQIPSKYLSEIYLIAKETGADIVKGRRISRENVLRRFLSKGYNIIIFLIFFVHINDINAKPKLMLRKNFLDMKITYNDWFIDTEIMINAKKRGYTVKEIPVEYKKRVGGKTHVKFSILFEFVKNLLKFRLDLQ